MGKYYLEDGAEVTADFAEVEYVKSTGVMQFMGWGECKYFYQGHEVHYDKKGRAYVEMTKSPDN
jgi:hypothetical protein